MASIRFTPFAAVTALAFLTACDSTGTLGFLNSDGSEVQPPSRGISAASTTLVERDVESPDVFSVTEAGLWDGRPSLGGVWVAHPDVVDPERVIIRNPANGQSVVGALFRRERENPGPGLQVSSNAAEELGLLAGQPAELSVIALRTEEVSEEMPSEVAMPVSAEVPSPMETAPTEALAAPAAVVAAPLDATGGANAPGREIDVSALSAAIATGETSDAAAVEVSAPAEAVPAQAAATPAAAPATSLSRPFIQVGIFSQEANANAAADRLRAGGIVPTVRSGNSGGNEFWRVVVGPAASETERSSLLGTVQGQGFADAYAVTN